MKKEEMEDLANLLTKAGLEFEKAEKVSRKVARTAQRRHISVMNALLRLADGGANSDSAQYQLYIALQNVSVGELIKITSSKSA